MKTFAAYMWHGFVNYEIFDGKAFIPQDMKGHRSHFFSIELAPALENLSIEALAVAFADKVDAAKPKDNGILKAMLKE